MVFLLGAMGAAADALPPVNADGVTLNQAAQDAAVGAIVDAALRDGLIFGDSAAQFHPRKGLFSGKRRSIASLPNYETTLR